MDIDAEREFVLFDTAWLEEKTTQGISPDVQTKQLAWDLWKKRAALAAPQQEPASAPHGYNDGAVYAIIFDDYERKHEIIIGESAARARFKRISDSWNAHLFGKIETNSRDSMYANNNFAPPAAPVLSDDEIVNIANETHIAMPNDCDDQAEMLAIVHAVLAAHGIAKVRP